MEQERREETENVADEVGCHVPDIQLQQQKVAPEVDDDREATAYEIHAELFREAVHWV